MYCFKVKGSESLTAELQAHYQALQINWELFKSFQKIINDF